MSLRNYQVLTLWQIIYFLLLVIIPMWLPFFMVLMVGASSLPKFDKKLCHRLGFVAVSYHPTWNDKDLLNEARIRLMVIVSIITTVKYCGLTWNISIGKHYTYIDTRTPWTTLESQGQSELLGPSSSLISLLQYITLIWSYSLCAII